MDPSEELNEMALELAKENSLDIDFIISGAESMDLESNSVDTVLVTYTLCTIPEVIASIHEIKRVLKHILDLIVQQKAFMLAVFFK